MTLGVKKVSNPFSILELCTIVREHDVDKADELRDRFEDFSLNNFTVAWTMSTVTIGGDLVVKLPISYGNLRKAKYDESIVLTFAKNLLAALPTVNESKELVAAWGEGEYEKHSLAEIVGTMTQFDANWIDSTKIPKEPVKPTDMSDDEIMDELFGDSKPETVGCDVAAASTQDSTSAPSAHKSFKQEVLDFASSQPVEPSGFAATLPLCGAFSMAITPPESHIGEEIGQYMKPSTPGNPYYRVLQVHETTSSKSVVGVRLQNKMLSFRVKGEICNRSQGELLKMCFKQHNGYMSIHLEVHDKSAVIAMTNTILGRLVESGVKVHTVFLSQG